MNQFQEIKHVNKRNISTIECNVKLPILKSEDLSVKEIFTAESLVKAKIDFEDRLNKGLSNGVSIDELTKASKDAQSEVDALHKGIFVNDEGKAIEIYYRTVTSEK